MWGHNTINDVWGDCNNHIDVRTMEIGLGVDAGHPPTNDGMMFLTPFLSNVVKLLYRTLHVSTLLSTSKLELENNNNISFVIIIGFHK